MKKRLLKRALKLVYPDQSHLTFEQLMGKDKTVDVHQNIFQKLTIKIHQVKNNFSP